MAPNQRRQVDVIQHPDPKSQYVPAAFDGRWTAMPATMPGEAPTSAVEYSRGLSLLVQDSLSGLANGHLKFGIVLRHHRGQNIHDQQLTDQGRKAVYS